MKTTAGDRAPEQKTPADFEELRTFVNEFTKESDRACVILTAAKVDYLCRQTLERFLLPNAGPQDELLDSDRALGTFSARIHALHRFGLIDAEFARALHLLRKLRNVFAHEVSGSRFEDGSHRDRIGELVRPLTEFQQYEHFRDKLGGEKPRAAAEFYTAAAVIIVRMQTLLDQVAPLSSTDARSFKPSGWKRLTPRSKGAAATRPVSAAPHS